MTAQFKTGGDKASEFAWTTGNVEQAATMLTEEMVVVGFRRDASLVTGWSTGNRHRHDHLILDQGVDGAIDRGNTQPRHLALRLDMNLMGPQRTTSFFNHPTDRFTLASVSDH